MDLGHFDVRREARSIQRARTFAGDGEVFICSKKCRLSTFCHVVVGVGSRLLLWWVVWCAACGGVVVVVVGVVGGRGVVEVEGCGGVGGVGVGLGMGPCLVVAGCVVLLHDPITTSMNEGLSRSEVLKVLPSDT